ncbi:MAG: c-type cytochrome [Deltaproteobacteria bacterium]|nr:MAG: c-type cytochrome [Deltaproteobacteria bacterium]
MANARLCVLLLIGSTLLPAIAVAQDFAAKGFKVVPTSPRQATPEDLAAGKLLYEELCSQCHGESGDGQGVMADLLKPRPRDFRRGIYKIRRTPQGELPTDEDLFRIISNGMPASSMPAWRGLVSDAQIWQLVDYIESFSEDFADYPAEEQFLLEGKPDPTPESLERGEEIYIKAECAKCHGESGRGNGRSAAELVDEWDFPIYPADLTEPWTLRGGGSVEDLYRTVTTGVNGTPMPSFSDAWNSDDLWNLANYLHSLGRKPFWGEILRGSKIAAVPEDAFSDVWEAAPVLDVRLLGQIIQEPRLFNPSVQTLSAQVLFDDNEIALLLTWRDRFENTGEDELPIDRVSVLFPAQELEEGKKPYFLMGDRRRPVDAWQWSANGRTETFLARGMDAVTPRTSPVKSQGVYRDGQYRVVLRRSLKAGQDNEVEFSPGTMIPIAWNVWDGQEGEDGKRRAVSRWYYLLLEPETPLLTWLWPIVVVCLTAGGEFFGLRRLRQHWARQQTGALQPSDGTESQA